MARNALLSALQAAMLAGAGGLQGSIQAKERETREMQEKKDREQRELINLITFGREAITPGPLASRVPAGTPAPEMPKGPPPSSVIPLPSGPVDMTGAMRQLETEETTPSGTIPLTFAGQTIYVPIGQRYRDEQEAARLRTQSADIESALAKARALQPLQMALATAATTAAGKVAAGRETAEAGRTTKAQERLRQESFRSLEAAGVQNIGPFDPNRRYEDEWASFTKMSPTDRMLLTRPSGGAAGTFPVFPGFTGGTTPAAPTATQRGNEVTVGGKKFIVPNP